MQRMQQTSATGLAGRVALVTGGSGGIGRAIVLAAGRLGRPAEVAELALAVLSNPYLSNQVISIDGGIYPH